MAVKLAAQRTASLDGDQNGHVGERTETFWERQFVGGSVWEYAGRSKALSKPFQ